VRKTTGPLPRSKRLFAVLCALAFAASSGRAQTFVAVSNSNPDTSAGSLGAALASPAANSIIIFEPYIPPVITQNTPYNSVGTLLTLDANQVTVNFQGTNGLNITAGGFVNFNGLTASGITVNTGGTLSTQYSSISGLTLNGGTFQTRDNSVTTGITLVGAGSGFNILDPAGNNPTMSGITGAGDLTVNDSVGGGIVTLVGGNNYSGNTFITAGTLQLGVNSALTGATALTTMNTSGTGVFDLNGFTQTLATVNNFGTVKTGIGTLTATTYNGGGTLSVGLLPGQLANLNVTGTAALNSGPLSVTGHPALGVYTIVTAGTLTGTFTQGTLPFGVTDTFSCNDSAGTCLIDILSDSPFTFAGQSANQAAIGNALNLASYSATGDLLGVINQLGAMTPAQANAAMDQIGPISFAALSGMSFAAAGVQSAAVAQRMTGLQAGGASPDGSRYASFNVQGQSSYPGTLVAELPGDTGAAYSDKDRLFDPNSRWGVFAAGLGTFDHQDGINGNSGFQPGYSLTATGETVGADYRFNDHFAAGVAGGYVNGFSVLGSGGGTIYGQSARLGVYGTAYNGPFHANLYLGGAHDFFDTSRNISAFSRVATASPSGQEFNMAATTGWDAKTAHGVVSPFLGLAYDRMMLGSFTEGGAGALDLAMDGQTAQSLRSVLGTKISRQFKPAWVDLTPYASIGWQHEFENQSRPLSAQLASAGSGTFTVMTADIARESALLGAGLNMDWTPGFSSRLAYESTLNFDFHANTFSGSVRWRF
jgi:uncharacterized protein with beta-barrel porin domain